MGVDSHKNRMVTTEMSTIEIVNDKPTNKSRASWAFPAVSMSLCLCVVGWVCTVGFWKPQCIDCKRPVLLGCEVPVVIKKKEASLDGTL